MIRRDSITEELDAGERVLTALAINVTAIGDNTVATPTSGKRFVLRKIKLLNDPTSSSSVGITVKLGAQTCISGWVIAERQRFVGAVDAALIINLSANAAVRGTAYYEEIA